MKNPYFKKIIERIKPLLMFKEDISDEILDSTKVDTLAKCILDSIEHAINNNLDLDVYDSEPCDYELSIIDENKWCYCCMRFYLGFTEIQKGPRIYIWGDGIEPEVDFYIEYSDLVCVLDKVITNLSSSDKAYLLLKNIDLEQFKHDVIAGIVHSAEIQNIILH